MARVVFSALIEEIVGKLAGSVFQDSYGGYQIRTRVSPRNPRSYFQQLRRGEFGYITQLWRSLTNTERSSWVDNAPAGQSGFNFFVQSNVNLSLINLAPIPEYIPATAPAEFQIDINLLSPPFFIIQASGMTSTVPNDTTLSIFSTAEKPAGKLFTSPSEFTPIATFAAGFDLSSPISIASDWMARFGQFQGDSQICLQTSVISSINGARSDRFTVCSFESPSITDFIVDDTDNALIDSDGTFIISI